MNPMQYAIYKGTGGKFGAVQFNLQRPHFYQGKTKDFTGHQALDEQGKRKEGWKDREGCIFLEITSAKAGQKNVYDWDNKIILALSITDIGKILYFLVTGKDPGKGGDRLSIMHDPGAKSQSAGAVKKFLSMFSPNGTSAGCLITAKQVTGSEERKHTVPLTGDEVIVLRSLLQAAIPSTLNW